MYSLILLMAGSGERLGLDYNKLLYKINNKEVIKYTLDSFRDERISETILVVSKKDYDLVKSWNLDVKLVIGGKTRSDSVKKGLEACTKDYVLIHDGARVLTSKRIINEHLEGLLKYDSVITLTKCYDSVKDLDFNEVERDNLYLTQTPLSFKTSLIKEAYEKETDLSKYRDDYLLFKKYYGSSKTLVVKGELINFKLTTKEDLVLLERLVAK